MIPFGRIARAHGVRGELRLVPYQADAEFPPQLKTLWLRSGDAAAASYALRGARPGPGAWLVRLDGVGDRDAASALRGCEVMVSPEELPPLEAGEFYLHELVGLEARSEGGEVLGTVAQVETLPGQDVLSLQTPRGRRMVPITPNTVLELRRGEGQVLLSVPEGLLE